MITTVTLNPAIDKVVEINNMSLGNVHRVSKQVVSFGGKSINVARILTGYNCETQAVCYLGKANYDLIKDLSNEDHLNLKPIMLEGLTRSNVKIVEPDQNFRTTDINEQGFQVKEDQVLRMTELITEQASISDYLVLSGSLPRGVADDYYKQLCLKLGQMTKVVVDADGQVLMSAMAGGPYMIKPNIHELESAVGHKLTDQASIVRVCRELIESYKMTYILVSMGEEGSLLVSKDQVLSAEAMSVQVVSTVGAGDSMLAGMLYGLSQMEDEAGHLTQALSYGVASSSIAISTQNHKSIQVSDLKQVADKVVIKEIQPSLQ